MVDYSKPIQSGQEPGLSYDSDRESSVDESASRMWSLCLGFCLLLLSLFLLFIAIPMSAEAGFSDLQAGLISVAPHATEPPVDSGEANYSSGWISEYWFSEIWHWLVPLSLVLVLMFALRWFGAGRRSQSKCLTDSDRGLNMDSPEAGHVDETDELTGLANMSKFHSVIDRYWDLNRHEPEQVSIVAISLNRLDQHGKLYGRVASDHLLCAVATLLFPMVDNAGGLLARYGSEELIALLPGQNLADGVHSAEAMLEVIMKLGFNSVLNESGSATASFGVACSMLSDGGSPMQLIKSAVQALNRAKRAGCNRIEAEDDGMVLRVELSPQSGAIDTAV